MTNLFTRALIGAFSFCILNHYAQENQTICGTGIPSAGWEQEIGRLVSEKKLHNKAAKGQTPVYVIPVIVHVIHGGQAVGVYPNLAQGQIVSQIQVLNNDFAGIGYNSGTYPVQAFSAWAATNQNILPNSLDNFSRIKIADCFVEFCLAKYDTLGNPLAEPGIDRVNYVSKGWSNPGGINSYNGFKTLIDGTIKPGTIWNVSKYFNIWLTDENINLIGLLGYATFPPLSNLPGISSSTGLVTTDGVWCYSKAFGSVDYFPTGSYYGSNNRGRTSTHEVGHYLGLRHIWGDGTCASDYCDDTPPADDKNFYSPTYPFDTVNCFGNAPDGEMFMNFMDYTNDASKYMFTEDQSLRIHTAMTNSPYRMFLGTHGLCTVLPIAATSSFALPTSICANSIISPTNHAKGTPPPTYTWNVSGGGSMIPGANSPYLILNVPAAGIYTVTLTTDNGTVSSTSKTFSVHPVPNLVVNGAPPVVCLGTIVYLTASGANSYIWQPSGITGNSYSFFANGSPETFTVEGTGVGNCKAAVVMTINSGICTGLEAEQTSAAFSVFPNPSSNVITIRSGISTTREIKITDVSGRTVFAGLQTENDYLIDISKWDRGIYFITSLAENGQSFTQRVVKD